MPKRRGNSATSARKKAKRLESQDLPSEASPSETRASLPKTETQPQPPEKTPSIEPESSAIGSSDNWSELKAKALQRLSEFEQRTKLEEDQEIVSSSAAGVEEVMQGFQALLEWLPSKGAICLADEILSVTSVSTDSDDDINRQPELGDVKLKSLFQRIKQHLINPLCMTVFAAQLRTLYPDTIIAVSNPSVVAGEMGPPPSRASAAARDDSVIAFSTNNLVRPSPPKFRNFLIKRENSLCAISKVTTFDLKNNKKLKINQETRTVESLEAAHILPFSFFSIGKTRPMRYEILQRYFPQVPGVFEILGHINHTFNGLLLADSIHNAFGAYRLTLKSTDKPDIYEIVTFPDTSTSVLDLIGDRKTVDFTACRRKWSVIECNVDTFDYQKTLLAEGKCPPPSQVLLDCHYRMAQIIHYGCGMSKFKSQAEFSTYSTEGKLIKNNLQSLPPTVLRHDRSYSIAYDDDGIFAAPVYENNIDYQPLIPNTNYDLESLTPYTQPYQDKELSQDNRSRLANFHKTNTELLRRNAFKHHIPISY